LFADFYGLASDAAILDVGCAKGFMLRDFVEMMPCITIAGIDISGYAIENADPAVRSRLIQGNAKDLPYRDGTFDLVISINTIHNLHRVDVIKALREIERVGRGKSFVMVDGWRTERERLDLQNWVLTAQTVLHADDWRKLFKESEFKGDYAFWTPN